MSDTKRIALIIGLIIWGIFALAVSTRAEEFTSPKCGNEVALNIPVQKKMGTAHRVTGDYGGFGGPSVSAGGSTCTTLAQASTDANVDYLNWANWATTPSIGTRFTTSKAMTVCKIIVPLRDVGTITDGTIYAGIYADNGSNNITGSAIGGNSNTINAANLTNTLTNYTFDGMSATLSNATMYWIVLTFTGTISADNYPNWQVCAWSGYFCTGNTTSLGEEVYSDRSGWFQLYE